MQEVIHQVGNFPFPCNALVGNFCARAVSANINAKLDLCRNHQRSAYAKVNLDLCRHTLPRGPSTPRSNCTWVESTRPAYTKVRLNMCRIPRAPRTPRFDWTWVERNLRITELLFMVHRNKVTRRKHVNGGSLLSTQRSDSRD